MLNKRDNIKSYLSQHVEFAWEVSLDETVISAKPIDFG